VDRIESQSTVTGLAEIGDGHVNTIADGTVAARQTSEVRA
jgi:hypothetical protein